MTRETRESVEPRTLEFAIGQTPERCPTCHQPVGDLDDIYDEFAGDERWTHEAVTRGICAAADENGDLI